MLNLTLVYSLPIVNLFHSSLRRNGGQLCLEISYTPHQSSVRNAGSEDALERGPGLTRTSYGADDKILQKQSRVQQIEDG